jgi:hypothetical protein
MPISHSADVVKAKGTNQPGSGFSGWPGPGSPATLTNPIIEPTTPTMSTTKPVGSVQRRHAGTRRTHAVPLNHQRPSAEYAGSHRSPFHHHRESGEWALDPGCVMKTECPALPTRRGRSQEMLPKRHARTNP